MADLIDEIAADIEAAMTPFLEKIADETRQRVSVPVGRAGRRLIRSKPGEPPRKDTGKLQGGIKTGTASVGDEVSGYVAVPVHYAEPLQTKMQRLILDDRADEFNKRFADAMAAAV